MDVPHPPEENFAGADDLAAGVDPGGFARVAEGAEVDHPAGRRPRERMDRAAGGGAAAGTPAAVVDRLGHAEAAAEGAEIDHPALHSPRKRMISAAGDGLAEADDLAAGIDPVGLAPAAAEGAEVDRPAGRGPQKRMESAASGGLAEADDLAAVVDRVGEASAAAEEGAEVDWNEGSVRCVRASGVRGQEYREQDEHSTSRARAREARSRAGSGASVDHVEYEAGESLSRRCSAHGRPPRCRTSEGRPLSRSGRRRHSRAKSLGD